ncbi:amino acid permease [Escherichia coli]
MDSKTFFPDFSKVGTLVVFVAFILSYMGVEASATHVNEMSNPGRDYPLAMLLLMVAAICFKLCWRFRLLRWSFRVMKSTSPQG